MRVDLATRHIIGKLAEEERASMQDIIARAVALYRREKLFGRMAMAWMAMTAEDRAAEQADAEAWNATLADGTE